MRRALLLCLPILLAGCAGVGPGRFGGGAEDPCEGREPLQVKGYVDSVTHDALRFEVSLWNCRDDRAFRVENPCGQHATLAPQLDVDGTRYVITWNGSAIPEADIPCERGPEPEVLTVEPRYYLQDQSYTWNGTLRQPDGAYVEAVGNHTVFAELAGYRARTTVEVPW